MIRRWLPMLQPETRPITQEQVNEVTADDDRDSGMLTADDREKWVVLLQPEQVNEVTADDDRDSDMLQPETRPITQEQVNEVTVLLQPETRPITQEQLVNEVKGIYAGLVMVEKKCVEVYLDYPRWYLHSYGLLILFNAD
jgi:hypothetical protein